MRRYVLSLASAFGLVTAGYAQASGDGNDRRVRAGGRASWFIRPERGADGRAPGGNLGDHRLRGAADTRRTHW